MIGAGGMGRVYRAHGSGKPELITGNEPSFSPDSKWIAFSSLPVRRSDHGR